MGKEKGKEAGADWTREREGNGRRKEGKGAGRSDEMKEERRTEGSVGEVQGDKGRKRGGNRNRRSMKEDVPGAWDGKQAGVEIWAGMGKETRKEAGANWTPERECNGRKMEGKGRRQWWDERREKNGRTWMGN
jgi:hypothetical protein